MGIQGLMPLIAVEAPDAIREIAVESYTGRIVAIDASMALYQFLISIRSQGDGGHPSAVLMNSEGEQTSHISGMFNRTIRLLLAGVKPMYVFDGKPPSMKSGELKKRTDKRDDAREKLKAAEEAGDMEAVSKYQAMLVKVGSKDVEDVKTLLRLMGVPVVDAPCEAEAQCAALCKEGKAHASGTEDMDVLTFGSPLTLRKLTFNGKSKDGKIVEVNHAKVLEGLGLTQDEFVDFCILSGCDYTASIRGVGPKTALKHILKYHTIEKLLASGAVDLKNVPESWLEPSKRPSKAKPKAAAALKTTSSKAAPDDAAAPAADEAADDAEAPATTEKDADDGAADECAAPRDDDDGEAAAAAADAEAAADADADALAAEDGEEFVPAFVQARGLFKNHEVLSGDAVPELKWTAPDEAGLRAFLCDRMSFSPARVDTSLARLKTAQSAVKQSRMDSFFKVVPRAGDAPKKRKAEEPKAAKGKAKGPAKKAKGKK
ncbi:PIN domain-like protein [Pelagophyceae sp. CCMP2097]|nr:PIN domain-like protein [Pelagophyceae sp. CCMP2097]|mmetsp:Transcript_12736/g.43998  ORF Transcript_12736/g.43998 Transcript_12736/m.43998 type:complete len:488 (+) Transcript_12736:33-1496(+)